MTFHRVRNGRRGNESRGASQPRLSAPSRDGSSSMSQGRRGGKAASSVNRSMDNSQNGPPMQSVLPPPDGYIPAPGLDAVEAMLKRGCDAKAVPYKPETKPQNTKSDTPWGVKRKFGCTERRLVASETNSCRSASTMSNGKDFWLDLRKQVTALQLSGGTSQGG